MIRDLICNRGYLSILVPFQSRWRPLHVGFDQLYFCLLNVVLVIKKWAGILKLFCFFHFDILKKILPNQFEELWRMTIFRNHGFIGAISTIVRFCSKYARCDADQVFFVSILSLEKRGGFSLKSLVTRFLTWIPFCLWVESFSVHFDCIYSSGSALGDAANRISFFSAFTEK